MVSPFIDLLDLLKNLSTFSTEIFVNRHFLLLFIKHSAWSMEHRVFLALFIKSMLCARLYALCGITSYPASWIAFSI
jgi:hypothetical protein